MAPGSDGFAPALGARMGVVAALSRQPVAGKGRPDASSLAAVGANGQGFGRFFTPGQYASVRVPDQRLVDRGDPLDGCADVAGVDVAALGDDPGDPPGLA